MLGLAALFGCRETEQAPLPDAPAGRDHPAWQEDAVMFVGEEPITAADIEAWVETVALVEPHHSRPDHLRKALTNLVLHKAVARQMDRKGWERARQRAEAALLDLQEGRGVSPEGPQVQDVAGCWNDPDQDIGMDRWGRARDWNPGEWHLLETLGGWSVARVLERPERFLPDSKVAMQHVTFYYLEPETMKREIEQALTTLEIGVLDPAWRDVLPVWYLNQRNPAAPQKQ